MPRKPQSYLTPIQHVVVEPHADDAFLSLGGHIERWIKKGERVTIVTVYSANKKRAAEAAAYAGAVGAGWIGFGYTESNCGLNGEADHLGDTLDPLSNIPYADSFRAWLALLKSGPHVYVPLAFRHPEHLVVRQAIEHAETVLLDEEDVLIRLNYYLDQPAASITKNAEVIGEAVQAMTVRSYLRPLARKYRHASIFKSQAKFFHFNPPDKLAGNVEMVFQ